MRRSRTVAALAAVAGVLALIAVVPVGTSDLVSHPRAMSDYGSATAEIGRRQDVDARVATPGGRSIFLSHGHRTPTVVLLLHGYTNSPLQFDSLGRILYRDGDNVYIPRLPHHADLGGGSEALSRMTAEEMQAAADSAVDIADGLGDTVVVVGLSLGGTMAAWITQYRRDARRVIMIAPLMGLARVPDALEVPLVNLAVRMPNVNSAGGSDVRQPDRETGWSSHAVGQILRLGLAVERASANTPPASNDIAILLNGHDHTISARSVGEVARYWRAHGATVKVYELPATLGLPHDVVDPRQRMRRPDVVYPVIAALVGGGTPSNDAVEDVSNSPWR